VKIVATAVETVEALEVIVAADVAVTVADAVVVVHAGNYISKKSARFYLKRLRSICQPEAFRYKREIARNVNELTKQRI
jgi:hypothetical protein